MRADRSIALRLARGCAPGDLRLAGDLVQPAAASLRSRDSGAAGVRAEVAGSCGQLTFTAPPKAGQLQGQLSVSPSLHGATTARLASRHLSHRRAARQPSGATRRGSLHLLRMQCTDSKPVEINIDSAHVSGKTSPRDCSPRRSLFSRVTFGQTQCLPSQTEGNSDDAITVPDDDITGMYAYPSTVNG